MSKEEINKRSSEMRTYLPDDEIIEGKKAYDYYNDQPFFQEKLRKAKAFLRKHPPPGLNPDDILD